MKGEDGSLKIQIPAFLSRMSFFGGESNEEKCFECENDGDMMDDISALEELAIDQCSRSESNASRPSSLTRPLSGRFNFSSFFTESPAVTPTTRQWGRTASFDIGQMAAPAKKLKKSPVDVIDIPSTPYEDSLSGLHASSYSRLNNEFRILDVIGTGTFGTVYRAEALLDGVVYAVKKSRKRPHNQTERTAMMHEVQALAALSANEDPEKASSVVRYYSAWMEDEYLCIQMELCDACAQDTSTFDRSSIFTLLRDILNALDMLHSNEFVHLDVKPGNILVKRNRYKLGDFGLALHLTNGKFNGNVEEGDSRYMARELLNWGPVQDITKCDIFSLGVTAYELYTGRVMESNGTEWHNLRDGVFSLPESSPGELHSILSILMAPDPKNRPTAKQCLQHYSSLKTPLEQELEYQKSYARSLEERLQGMQETFVRPRMHSFS